MTVAGRHGAAWTDVRDQLRSRGLRWTPQRRLVLDVLGTTRAHTPGRAVVERCRPRDPETSASTVYRTLDVLEELGYLQHTHGVDGREEFHVLPESDHAHLRCSACGRTWEVPKEEAAELVRPLEERRGFEVALSHLTVTGRCADCLAAARSGAPGTGGSA
jgi:Fur family ferric uptake transcriptional regulator